MRAKSLKQRSMVINATAEFEGIGLYLAATRNELSLGYF